MADTPVGRGEWSALYLSVPTTLRDALKAAADDDGRKLAKYIERVLTEHIQERASNAEPQGRIYGASTSDNGSESRHEAG